MSNQTMRQELMTEPKNITFRDVAIPEPHPNEVLVKVKRIGICGSDIHVFHGSHPYTSYPVTQGHEVSAEVVKIGEAVKNLKVGDKIAIEPQVFCGRCHPCLHGKYNLCENLQVMGFQTVGAASEFFALDSSKATKVPDSMTFDQAAMLEPLAVAVHAVKRFNEIKGAKVAVLGAGPIGQLIQQTAKAMGASQVLVTDISNYRLELAKNTGADFVLNTKEQDFAQGFVKAFGADKADVIFECAGSDITMNQAIQNARKGSTIVLVAVFGKMATVDLAKLNDSELDLNTSMMYRHEDYVDAIAMVADGRVKLEPLMSKHFAFEDFQKAYEYIDNNRETTMKVLVDVAE